MREYPPNGEDTCRLPLLLQDVPLRLPREPDLREQAEPSAQRGRRCAGGRGGLGERGQDISHLHQHRGRLHQHLRLLQAAADSLLRRADDHFPQVHEVRPHLGRRPMTCSCVCILIAKLIFFPSILHWPLMSELRVDCRKYASGPGV